MKELKRATFAGGCFWCLQPPFRMMTGVVSVVSGYAGGTKENPTYEEVSSGTTGHVEAVQVTYDPDEVSYDDLLGVFWRQIDPTDEGGQFADRGPQYRTAIFYHDEEQRELAEASRKGLADSGKFARPVVTGIRPYTNFYPAGEYHQEYDRKNPARYSQYKKYSGRGPFIDRTWGPPGRVTVFSTPGCHNCRAVREYLSARKIAFDDVDLTRDPEAARVLAEETGQVGAPVVRIGNGFVAGADLKKIAELLRKAGLM